MGIRVRQVVLFGLLLAGASALPAVGALDPGALAKLGVTGTPLTPMGAQRAGNADGSIPPWTGGIKQTDWPAGFRPGGPWLDPFAGDEPLFTIDASNYRQYADKLTAGQIAMLERFPDSYRMHVYPSRRSIGYEDWVYQATLRQAAHAEVCPEWETARKVCLVNHVDGGGIPFPIPKNGVEAGWSHYLAYRGQWMHATENAPLIDANGHRVDVILEGDRSWAWWVPAEQRPASDWFQRDGGPALCDSFQIKQPPRSSGLYAGACDYVQNVDFQAYLYVPGQRRVRRAPEIGFQDSPSFGSDGQRTVASRWMWWFGGAESRFDLKLLGKREIYVPYNSYALAQEGVGYDDIFGPKHINQDLVRYELHRVWVLEADRLPQARHLYKKHVAYFDEDSWLGVASEAYDSKDRLWRVAEQYNLNFYDIQMSRAWGDSQIDLVNGRYSTFFGWPGNGKAGQPVFKRASEVPPAAWEIFTPAGLRKAGHR